LAPVADDDPDVLTSLVDSIEPPALMLGWGEPWLEPLTSCNRTGRLVVTCVSSRLALGDGIAQLEQLVDYTLARLTSEYQLDAVSGPRAFTIAKTNYLAARVTVRATIS
ncbi:MAG TPA: hypothetical protein VJM49_06760, partial [Acidimicrobiales bacterium]|nr:hypothetical protein [Acidimicrobiales bacterium]